MAFWFMVYGLWFMVYGLWFMVYGLRTVEEDCNNVAAGAPAGGGG